MLLEKNIRFDIKVEIDTPMFGKNINEVLSPVLNKMVKKTLKKFLNNNGKFSEYTENNIKIIINKNEEDIKKSIK